MKKFEVIDIILAAAVALLLITFIWTVGRQHRPLVINYIHNDKIIKSDTLEAAK
jgi:hypothetical protein